MHIHCVNVNDAFKKLVRGFHEGYIDDYHLPLAKTPSTQGECIYIQEPMLITYEEPLQRVLFNQARDANPFLHMYESLYMLTGRNDVAPLAYYAKQWNEYSDDGQTLNGSYGYRWRRKGKVWADSSVTNQLSIIIDHLRSSSTSRRAVLQIWNVEDDLLKIGGSALCPTCKGEWTKELAEKMDESPEMCPNCGGDIYNPYWNTSDNKPFTSKDVCCNLSVLFLVREAATKVEPTRVYKAGKEVGHGTDTIYKRYLDMTVTNRSNDLIWGLTGTNYCVFSVLQEYMAAHIGVEVGKYHHFTNNCHVYTSRFKPQEWLDDVTPTYYTKSIHPTLTPNGVRHFPLIKDPEVFDKELPLFVEKHKNGDRRGEISLWSEPFLDIVAEPMFNAFHLYKAKEKGIQDHLTKIHRCDWRVAAEQWIQRRTDKQKKKDVIGE